MNCDLFPALKHQPLMIKMKVSVDVAVYLKTLFVYNTRTRQLPYILKPLLGCTVKCLCAEVKSLKSLFRRFRLTREYSVRGRW